MYKIGFSGGSVVKNPPTNAGDMGLIPELGRFPRRRKQQLTPEFLRGKSHEQRSLVGYSSWGCKRIGHDLATKWDLPDGSNVKESACSAGDLG